LVSENQYKKGFDDGSKKGNKSTLVIDSSKNKNRQP